MSDSESSTAAMDFKRQHALQLASQDPSKPVSNQDKKRKRRGQSNSKKRIKAQAASRAVLASTAQAEQNQHTSTAAPHEDTVDEIKDIQEQKTIEEIFEDLDEVSEEEKRSKEQSGKTQVAATPVASSELTAPQVLQTLQALTGSINKLDGMTHLSSDVDFASQRLEDVRRQLLELKHDNDRDSGKIELLQSEEAILRVERDLAKLRVRLEAARGGNNQEAIAALEAEGTALEARAAMLRVERDLAPLRVQLEAARGKNNQEAIVSLKAEEAILRVERDLAPLRVRLEAAREREDMKAMVSLEAREAMLQVERDLAPLRVRLEAARGAKDKEVIASLEAEEAKLREHLLAVQAAAQGQHLVEAPEHPWMNMAEATIEDLGDAGLGMTKLTIPTKDLMYLESQSSADPDTPQVNPHVLIVRPQLRQHLDVILSRVEANHRALYALTGVPGIGKTIGSNYLLKRCYDMKRIVITHELNNGSGWLLKPGEVPVYLPTSGRVGETIQQYWKRKPLYLVDTGKGAKDSMHRYTGGVTVLTASPNPSHFDQNMKSGDQRWISPWTKEELEVALPHIVINYEDTKDLIWERFEDVGGSLRVLFYNHRSYNKFCADRLLSIRKLGLEKLSQLLNGAASASNAGDDGKVSHKLIHVFATDVKDDQQLAVRFASPRVYELLLEAQMVKASDLTPYVVSINDWKGDPRMAKAAGDYYEFMFFVAAHQQWLGRSFDAKIWNTEYDRPRAGQGESDTTGCADGYTIRPIPATKVMLLKRHMTAADVESLCDPGVGLVVVAPKNWPAVDGWLYMETEAGEKEIWLLQHTVASSHDVKGKGFAGAVQHARRGAWSDAKYRLVFIVPSKQADIYRAKKQTESPFRANDTQQYIHPWTGELVGVCGSWLPTIDGSSNSAIGAELVAAERFAIQQRGGRIALSKLLNGPDRLPTLVWELEPSWILRDRAKRGLASDVVKDEATADG